jgi:hypothetical protein
MTTPKTAPTDLPPPGEYEPWDYDDDGICFDCGQIWDLCDCRVGEECGRWRNGVLSDSCSKAGSEECDFECPYRDAP